MKNPAQRSAAIPRLSLILLVAAALPSLWAQPALPPLTTLSNSPRLPGKFVWGDLVTDDVPAARRFYSSVFGWKFQEFGSYTIVVNEDAPIAGMFQRPRPTDRSAEPRWFGYISVPSVDRAQRAAEQGGGRVVAPPQKMPDRGTQAVLADPEGALFGVIRSSAGDPPDSLAEPGDWIWIQLLSRDAQKAAAFYRSIANYEVVENTTANALSDYVLVSEGYARATVRTIPASDTQVKPTWLPFVRVKSVAETVALAQSAGGRVRVTPKKELLDGKVAVISDPTGAVVGIMEWSEALMKGGK